MTHIWKSPKMNRFKQYRTISIFKEYANYPNTDKYEIEFTLADEDDGDIESMPKIFKRFYQDVTEYKFVHYCFDGDFNHWEALKENKQFRKHYENWKAECINRLKCEAMQKIVETAMDDGNRNSFQALKYLVEREEKKTKKKKEEKKVEEIDKSFEEDLKRIQE